MANSLVRVIIPTPDSLSSCSPETPASRLQTEDPLNNEEGKTEEEETRPTTVDWSSLDIPHKLDSLHTLVEWQFQNPLRLRGLMKSDDETASWVRNAHMIFVRMC